jgi:glycosyltransferase involved in cell wall biosynthesis
MKIAYVAAGAAGMYCGSCIHDNTLAGALIRQGQDVTLIPTYTPIRTEDPYVGHESVFYGAINVYLQEKFSLFRRTPRIVDWILDRPPLLNWVSRFASTTSAQDLGTLTVSMLQGELGNQRKELEKLIAWLQAEIQPDLVQLTNSMFLGLAREIRQSLGVPVLCSLQGEEIFLDDLVEPYKTQARSLLRERASEIDGFVAPSHTYAEFMSEYLGVTRQKIHVVPLGLKLEGHGGPKKRRNEGPVTIGYLARICPEKGLHQLVEAFDLLVHRMGKENLRLEIAGYLGARDRAYLEEIVARIVRSEWSDRFKNRGEVNRSQKLEFLNSLDILSVPTTYKDPKGLFILEALANEVCVVQPAHGSFPEIIEATGGGRLVEPDSVEALADGLQLMVENRAERERMAKMGKQAVFEKFSDEALAGNALGVYRQFVPD